MRLPPTWARLVIVAALLASATSACAVWKTDTETPAGLPAAGEEGPVRVVTSDGGTVVIVAPLVDGDSLFGATEGSHPKRVAIPLSHVVRVEKMNFSLEKTADGVLVTQKILMGVVLLGGFLAILLSRH